MEKRVESRLQSLERGQGSTDQVRIKVVWDDDESDLEPGDVVVWMDQEGDVHRKVIREKKD